jgi:hypothetical protein
MTKTKWLTNVLLALGGPGNEHDSLVNLLTYIGREESYREAWEAAVKASGLLLPDFNGLTTYAIQSWCNLSLNQMSLLRRCLRAQLGSALFSTEY